MSNKVMSESEEFLASLDRNTRNSYALSARYVDDEVAKGRDLEEVFQELLSDRNDRVWFNPEILRYFSAGVEDTFKTSPIPLRMPNSMRLALEAEARKSKVMRSEIMRELLQEALDARAQKRKAQEEVAGDMERPDVKQGLDDAWSIILEWGEVDGDRKPRARAAMMAVGHANYVFAKAK